MRLTYSRTNMNIILYYKNMNIIKYEYSVSHLKEKILRHAFFSYLFLYTLRCLGDKGRGIFVSSP